MNSALLVLIFNLSRMLYLECYKRSLLTACSDWPQTFIPFDSTLDMNPVAFVSDAKA